MDTIISWVYELPPELAVLLIAALPVVELRGAIPFGIFAGLHPAWAWALGVAGSMLPVAPILLALGPLCRALRGTRGFRTIVAALDRYSRGRSGQIRRYGPYGLMLLVAVPLPSTGAWTGAILASLLGLRLGPAFAAILAGSGLAGAAVVALALLGLWAFMP